jgi:PASTA domain
VVIWLPHAGDPRIRGTSGRAAAVAMLLAGLTALALAGRLLPAVPSARGPAAAAPTGAATIQTVPIRTAPGNTRGNAVPHVLGHTLAQAERMLRTVGLRGGAMERDPQDPDAVVVAQEPPAGQLVPPGSMVGFRTRTGVQAYGAPRRLRLGPGPASSAYRIVAPDPAVFQLVVDVVAPRDADVAVWLEAGAGSRLPVLASTVDASWCRAGQRAVRCRVRLGVPAEGLWTATVAKHSSPPAAIQITVTGQPL